MGGKPFVGPGVGFGELQQCTGSLQGALCCQIWTVLSRRMTSCLLVFQALESGVALA